MLQKIKLVNFQSHSDTELEFVPGLNVITGGSHVGKSAFLRAARMVLRNKPSRSSLGIYLRHGSKYFSIDAVIDGKSVTRERGEKNNGKVNSYIIDGNDYQTVGSDVPEELREWLGGDIVDMGGKEYDLSFMNQFDSHFLIFEPDGLKAKAIGKLSGMEELDDGVKQANSESDKEWSKADQAKKRVQEIDEKIFKLDNLEYARTLHDDVNKKENKKSQISSLIKIIYEIKESILTCQKVIDKDATSLIKILNSLIKKVNEISNLNEKNAILKQSQQVINESVVRQFKLNKIGAIETLINKQIKALNNLEALNNNFKQLQYTHNLFSTATIGLLKIPFVDKIDKKVNGVVKNIEKYNTTLQMGRSLGELQPIVKESNRVNKLIVKLKKYINTLNNIKPLLSNINEFEVNHNRLGQYKSLLKENNAWLKRCNDCEKELKSLIKEEDQVIKTIRSEMSSIPVCNECNQPLMDMVPENILGLSLAGKK